MTTQDIDLGVVARGPQGPKGEAGATGPQGPQGNTGPTGPQGATGPAGPTGANIIKYDGDIPFDGHPGLTATFDRSNLQPSDIAKVGDIVFDQYPNGNGIDIGFWRITSLSSTSCTVAGLSSGFTIPKGNKGDTGARGPQGIQGPKGDKGDTGQTGPQGEQGIQGPKGEQGIQGQQGIQGPAGKPFGIKKTYATVALLNANGPNDLSEGDFAIIDSTVDDADNAKLFVWTGGKASLVTDMSGAQGVQGPQGKQGVQGTQGPQGVQGEQGATGATGMSGKSYKPYINKSDGHWHMTVDDPNDVLTDPFAVTIVQSGTYDGLTTSGYYEIRTSSVTGGPNTETGVLKVISANGKIITQTMHTASDAVWIRNKHNGAWTTWRNVTFWPKEG